MRVHGVGISFEWECFQVLVLFDETETVSAASTVHHAVQLQYEEYKYPLPILTIRTLDRQTPLSCVLYCYHCIAFRLVLVDLFRYHIVCIVSVRGRVADCMTE